MEVNCSEDKRRLHNFICIILSVLIVAVLGCLAFVSGRRETAYSAALEAQQEEAKSYEEELQNLWAELATMEEDYIYSTEEVGLMVGFLISEETDLEYIADLEAEYGFTPVLVLDCVMNEEELRAILDVADESWEIMLYATAFSEAVNEDVISVLSYLESAGRTHTGAFLLRQDYCNDRNIALLKEDGFIGYTVYNDSTLAAGQADDGMIYFEYSYLSATGTVIESRLSAFYNAQTFMIVIFDMASINSGALSTDYVLELLDIMHGYTEKDDCVFITVADAVEELSHVNELKAQYQAEYEERYIEIQERITELKEIIAGIYRQ